MCFITIQFNKIIWRPTLIKLIAVMVNSQTKISIQTNFSIFHANNAKICIILLLQLWVDLKTAAKNVQKISYVQEDIQHWGQFLDSGEKRTPALKFNNVHLLQNNVTILAHFNAILGMKVDYANLVIEIIDLWKMVLEYVRNVKIVIGNYGVV